jgi:arylsulfatase A-like enzyme
LLYVGQPLRRLFLVGFAILASGCSESLESPEVVVVAQRLRGEDFGAAQHFHAPMLAIGNTAREVITQQVSLPITDLQTALFADGMIEMDLDVAAVSGQAAIDLEVISLSLPVLLAPEAASAIASGGRFIRLERGWELVASSGGRMRVSVQAEAVADAVTDEQDTSQLLFRLVAREPVPAELRSRLFALPPDASIEIPWGLLVVSDDSADRELEVRATLVCGDKRIAILEETVRSRSAEPGWRLRTVSLPAGLGSCRLELTQMHDDGTPSSFFVWGTPQITARRNTEDLRVVLISLDTLRADHMSGYGYSRPTTPEIDRRLIDRGVRFRDAMTTMASTGEAHLSLFTGEFPREQLPNGRLNQNTRIRTLAELLQAGSFATAAFTEDGLISGPFGFWYGFDFFREYHVLSEGRGESIFEDGIDYIRKNRDRRFFLFLHTYKVHDPWDPTPATQHLFRDGDDWRDGRLDSRIPESQRDTVDDYDRTIVEADRMVADFLDELERLGLSENTLVVLLSDHGEAFGEHGILGHGLAGHQEQLQIPLVFRGPGIAQGILREEPAGITDVPSTILDLAGLPHEGIGSSRSLASLLRPEANTGPAQSVRSAQPLFFSRLLGDSKTNPFDGVRVGAQKFVRDGSNCSLYDMNTDPQEDRPTEVVCAESPLSSEIDRHRALSEIKRSEKESTGNDTPAISRDTAESLRVLGYVD